MADNLALTKDINVFPMLSGGSNPDFAEGDPILGLARLSGPAGELALDGDEARFVAVLHQDGRVLHRHEWTWSASDFETDSPMLLVNLVPSKDMGGKGDDWTAGFARALDGLEGRQELTFQLEAPTADPPVIAVADFVYVGGGGEDYEAYAKDLEDFMARRGKYAPKPVVRSSSGGGGKADKNTVTTHIFNNCANNTNLVLMEPGGGRRTVLIRARRTKAVTVPIGTRLDARDADDGSKLNQRLKVLDREFYDGMTSNLCR